MKPNNGSGKGARDCGKTRWRNQYVAAAEVDFVSKLQRDRLRSDRFFRIGIEANNRFDPRLLSRRQRHKRVSRPQRPARELPRKSAETKIRPNHVLNGKEIGRAS